MDMIYTYLCGKAADISRTLKRKFFPSKGNSLESGQDMAMDANILTKLRKYAASREDGIIYKNGRPAIRIEKLEHQTVVTDHATNRKFFIYDDGAIYGDNGHKLGILGA